MAARSRVLGLALGLALALPLVPPAPAVARKAKVYKYETREGKVDYGTEVPPGAVVLAEVGETEVAGEPAAGTPGSPAPLALPSASAARDRVASTLERMLSTLADRPVAAAGFAVAVFLLAVLILRAFPPIFSTLALDLRRSARLVTLVAAGWLILALLGQGLEWLYVAIGWSPRAEFDDRTLAGIALALYALVAVVAFAQRLGVGAVQALLLAALWLAIVTASAWALWTYAVA